MADLKISALPASTTPLAGTEVLPIVQSSATKQVTVANLTAGRAVATGALTVTGDATLSTGNLVQGTAAKGINFTANTPAAGMTSQLLNWYEEGTWTPVQGSGLAVVGTFSSEGIYTRVGRVVTLFGRLNATTSVATSATTQIICTGLPFSSLKEQDGGLHTANYAIAYGAMVSIGNVFALEVIPASTSIFFTLTYII